MIVSHHTPDSVAIDLVTWEINNLLCILHEWTVPTWFWTALWNPYLFVNNLFFWRHY